jgi:carotenoid cleavage oxygenase
VKNAFLEGNLAPVHHEETVTELRVTGRLPSFLNGRYIRNGPNPVGAVDPARYSWMMGDGMVHGVRLRDGRAQWYRNRWVRGARVAAALNEPRRPRRLRAGAQFLAANTNVIGHAGRVLALVEGGSAVIELTEDLDTVGPCDFAGTLSGGYAAHPILDPARGELHAVSYSFGLGRTVRYSVIGRDGRVRRTVAVPVGGSPMMHSFSLTEHYVIVYDLPVTFDATWASQLMNFPPPIRGLARLTMSALVGRVPLPDPVTAALGNRAHPNRRLPYRWNPAYPARIGVLPREGAAEVRWFEVEPCYVFHPLNAWQDADTIVIHLARLKKVFDGAIDGLSTLERWTVDLGSGKVLEERLDDRGQELPRVDERRVGRRNRYGYTVAGLDLSRPMEAVVKHDLERGTSTTREFGAGTCLSEFAFVPRGADAAEDDGVLMGYLWDPATELSRLMVLDAPTLDTVAAVELPVRVPQGFHGNWLPDSARP